MRSKTCALGCSTIAIACLFGSAASAQQAEGRSSPETSPDDSKPDIIVIGKRGSAVTDIAPIAELDADAVAATGAATVPELLQAIRGTTQSADGSEPIFLLNAQRISGFAEIGTLPPEAIEKVEVLPEQAALKFGFPPTRRLVNFITKRRFRQIEASGSAGTTTRRGSATEKANLGMTRLRDGARLTIGIEYRHTDPLLQSERSLAPDPGVPFDAIGNITAPGGGEIDPALSAVAGRPVRIASVPENPADRGVLAGYVAGADRPRLFDLGPYRTLMPGNDAVKVETVVADRIGETLSGSISLSAEQSRDRSLGGPATARLLVPDTNGFSPFAGPVLLNRYLTEAPVLRADKTETSLHAGLMLRGAIAGWRWDLTGSLDQKQTRARTELGISPDAANQAIAAGADPFAPLDPSLLSARLVDRTRQRVRTAEAKAVITNTPIRLPAGGVVVTATAEAGRTTAVSSSVGPNPSDLRLGRGRAEAGIALEVPLASRREKVLGFVGELSVNASVNARQVGGFGALHDTAYGLSWGPLKDVQLLATVKHSATAPDMVQQSTPVTRVPNVPVFDFGSGRTELVTLVQGGNPDLAAERRTVRSLALSLNPLPEMRLALTYEAATIRGQTGTVYAITPQTEALLPDLFLRDSAGRLTSVTYQPINFAVERQRTLNLTVSAYGKFGKAPPPPPGTKGAGPAQTSYYAGIGPSIRFSDRLQLRPGTPELDLLRGDTVRGWGVPRAYGYAYAGVNYLGHGMKFDAWYQSPNRVRSPDPAGDLHFSSIFKLNLGGYVALGSLLKQEKWARRLRLALDISNLTDAHQHVRDRNGVLPNRFQPDYLDPIGRTATVTLRKLF
ncbi:MAG: TonB-dependent receptor [Sphingomonas sp.]|uniref:TonB-dependent receptor n=1 Tax=Sphingomonas sp. TaxID=28214 RepID=UPI001B10985B|nr:TonB-dependent receptor [Sphingomonas sp.]MBO9621589.1 TonB-dependent receptor [Sphingomonas sp.]